MTHSGVELSRIAAELGLPATGAEQDWGVELADARRLLDWLAYFDQAHGHWSDWTLREYVDLVMQSAYEALDDGAHPSAIDAVRPFVVAANRRVPDRIHYWASFRDGDDLTPIAAILRAWGFGQ